MMDKVRWYAARLRAMPLGELGYRVRQAVVHAWDHAAARRGRSEERTPRGQTMPAPVGLLAGTGAARVRRIPSDVWEPVERYAHAIAQGRIACFGRDVKVSIPPAWHTCPMTGRVWPPGPTWRMDIRGGGVRLIWELSRHEFVVTLAAAYARSRDEAWAERVGAVLADWVDQNPPLTGVHWTSPLEMGIRLMHWSLAYDLTMESPAWTSERLEKIVGSARRQARFIHRHRSAYSSANNHLLGELLGLAAFGLSFPGAAKWLDVADTIQRFWAEVRRQTTVEGVSREQTFHYQAFVLQMGAWLCAALQVRGVTIPDDIRARFTSMADTLWEVTGDDGTIAAIGDADDGHIGCVGERREAGDVPAWIDALEGRVMRCASAPPPTAWLLAAEVPRRAEGVLASQGVPRVWHWADAGYAGWAGRIGGRACWLLMDAGPLGYLSLAAHGHADALALWLRDGREWLWEDSGTYTYHEDKAWRRYFRGTSAHNTLIVEGRDQSEQTGPTIWQRKASATFTRIVHHEHGVLMQATHDGYGRLATPALHERSVMVLDTAGVLVLDRLVTDGTVPSQQRWHLGAGRVAEAEARDVVSWSGSEATWCMRSSGLLRVVQASEGRMDAWRSTHYGELHPGTLVVSEAELRGGAVLATWWWPGSAESWSGLTVSGPTVDVVGRDGRIIATWSADTLTVSHDSPDGVRWELTST